MPRPKKAAAVTENSALEAPQLFEIVPPKKLDGTQVRVSFDDINCPTEFFPDHTEIMTIAASIRQWGLLQPIIVSPVPMTRFKAGDKAYDIVAGRRRYLAIKQIRELEPKEFTTLLCFCLMSTPTEVTKDALSLLENQVRRPNPIAEAESLLRMRMAGCDQQMICQLTTMPVTVQDVKLRFANIVPELKKAITDGFVGRSNADTISKMSPSEQKILLEVWRTRQDEIRSAGEVVNVNPDINAGDVRKAKEEIAKKIPVPLTLPGLESFKAGMQSPEFKEAEAQHDWAKQTIYMMEQVLLLIPDSKALIKLQAQSLLVALKDQVGVPSAVEVDDDDDDLAELEEMAKNLNRSIGL